MTPNLHVRLAPLLVKLLLGLSLAVCGPACSGASSTPETAPGAASLPPYDPGESALFGDRFSPDFFGLDREQAPADDDKLLARTQRADSVLLAKISTVTRDSTGERVSFQVTLITAPTPIAGKPMPEPITLEIDASSPSFAWVQSLGAELVGRTGILFAKRYNHAGVITLHWHVEADTPEVRRAVERARLVTEVGA